MSDEEENVVRVLQTYQAGAMIFITILFTYIYSSSAPDWVRLPAALIFMVGVVLLLRKSEYVKKKHLK